MKLRRLPDDFQVREINTLPIGSSGTFAVYELRKTGWTTLDALGHFSRTLNLPRRNIAHAGLKDRHAVTTQIITIKNGPRRSWHEEKLSLAYLGQSPRETTSQDILKNEFRIVLRSLSPEEEATARKQIPLLKNDGLPNYFDDQRFGSWFKDHGFIAEAWVREDYEKALWLTFAEHHPEDDPVERGQKAILRQHWKDWVTCKQLLERSHRRSVVTFLCDKPADFKGAWGIVNGDLRGLYLSALQSHLWNQIVSDFFASRCSPDQLVPFELKTGTVHSPQGLSASQGEALAMVSLSLPSARVKLEEEPERTLMEESLARQGWTFPQLKVRFPRDRFFSRLRRAIYISLDDLTECFEKDELAPSSLKVTLKFSLPRGSYATMVVKRLLTGTKLEEELEEEQET